MRANLRKKADRASALRCSTLVCVLENPKTVANIGTVLRIIDGLGISKLHIVSDRYNGEWNKRKKRELQIISASASKWVFVKYFETTNDCFDYLQNRKYTSVVTSPHPHGTLNYNIETFDYTKYKKLAIWFGNETHGISKTALSHSIACLQIPMCGIIESLNVGISTVLVLYRASTDRRTYSFLKHKKKMGKFIRYQAKHGQTDIQSVVPALHISA